MHRIEGAAVAAKNGKPFGQVTNVLFHPREPRVVGLELQPPALGMVVTRPPRYVRLADVRITSDHVEMRVSASSVKASAGEGFTWDDTVIWFGMPVRTRSGKDGGLIGDVSFDAETGAVRSVTLTGGLTADAAIGVRKVAGDAVVGFDGDNAVLIEDVLRESQFTGGAAKKAGETAAIVKVKAGQLGKQAADATVAGAIAAANSPTGKRARRAVKSWISAAKDAMRVDEDE